jgi:hypothetical protein
LHIEVILTGTKDIVFKVNEQEVTSKKKNVEPNADLKGLNVAASAIPNYLLSKICNLQVIIVLLTGMKT